jgi:hypothetical protein
MDAYTEFKRRMVTLANRTRQQLPPPDGAGNIDFMARID